MELVVIAGSAFFIGLTGAVTPGPLLALDIRESLRVGVRAGILVSTGHALADLIMLILLIVGMDQIPDSDSLVSIIGIIGGISNPIQIPAVSGSIHLLMASRAPSPTHTSSCGG